jgi:GNAT superfamily N-acetyltransferase
MNIKLQKVKKHELIELHSLQISAFEELLRKYQDFDTNPGAESLQKIEDRYFQSSTTYFFIKLKEKNIGAIRIIYKEENESIRISPMFIHPEYQNQHLGKEAVLELEKLFTNVKKWSLDTILQENKLCHFYENLGYSDTGEREKVKDGMDIIFYHKFNQL